MRAEHEGLRGVLGGSTRRAVMRRLGLALAIAVAMVTASPAPASASWFKRHVLNTNGAKRTVSRMTNPNGAIRIYKTNLAGLERWLKRVCARPGSCNSGSDAKTVPVYRF